MKTFMPRVCSAVVFASVIAFATSAAAQSESAGVAQYFSNCASCHESNEPGHQAPKTSVLKQMAPERIPELRSRQKAMFDGIELDARINSDADFFIKTRNEDVERLRTWTIDQILRKLRQ